MKLMTLTLNPAIDLTITLDHLQRGEVHRARSLRQDAGGKGVNVSACLADWGLHSTATGLLGQENTQVFELLFRTKNINDQFIRAPGTTRSNIKLVDPDTTTDINLPGIATTPALLEQIRTTLLAHSHADTLLVIAGSLPQDCPPDYYSDLIATLQARGTRIVLDTSGDALSHVLNRQTLPWAIKPNRHELAAWVGRPLEQLADIADEALRLQRRGIGLVVVSLGEQGALFAHDQGLLHAQLSTQDASSTVGAGDAMVAGIVAALEENASLERLARLATAFAVAKLGQPGPNLPAPARITALAAQVTLRPIPVTGEQV